MLPGVGPPAVMPFAFALMFVIRAISVAVLGGYSAVEGGGTGMLGVSYWVAISGLEIVDNDEIIFFPFDGVAVTP